MTCQTSEVEGVSAGKGLMAHDGQGGCQTTGKAKENLVSLLNPPFHSCMHHPLHAKEWRQRRRTSALQPGYSMNLSGYVLIIISVLLMLNAADMVYSEDDSLWFLSFLLFGKCLKPELNPVPPCFRDPCYLQVLTLNAADVLYRDEDSLDLCSFLLFLSVVNCREPELKPVTLSLCDHGYSQAPETSSVWRYGNKTLSYLCNPCCSQVRIGRQILNRNPLLGIPGRSKGNRKSWLKFLSHSPGRNSLIVENPSHKMLPSYLGAANMNSMNVNVYHSKKRTEWLCSPA